MRLLLLLSICWTSLAWGEDLSPLTGDEKRLLQERAKALHDKAEVVRQEAEAGFAADNKACWEKFLVSSCLEEAKKAKNDRLEASRRLIQEGREVESNLRRRNYAEHEAQMTESAPRHNAEAEAQAEKNRRAQEEAMARVERRRREAEQRENR